ncbi:hypothetical protein [Parvibium lacunae]|uniref:Glycosyltransferase RgtA/B/C/D-like domain-containing protein n=1 Tax=Parvibium lacunae TaxID=1888893 RepID=A0A368L077_9BURK|nr:hypothetical protein [Parvibium lacunae]RCS56963.1 hypothetical protein DU000_09125 [Parvibium lacunae]
MSILSTRQHPLTQPRSLLALLFCLACGLIAWRGSALPFIDEREYLGLAQNLLAGHGYIDADSRLLTAYRPPGYPFLLAGLQALTPSVLLPKLLNAFFLLGIGLGLRHLTQQLLRGQTTPQTPPLPSLLSPQQPAVAESATIWLLLASPLAIYTSSTLYPQIFGSLLLVLVLCLLIQPPHWGRVCLAGLLYGYLILTIPSFMYIAPFCALYLWWRGSQARPDWRSTARTVLFTFAVLAVMAPWTYRNWQTLHAFVPVSTNGGVNLLYGNSENTRYNTGGDLDIDAYKKIGFTLSEIDADRYYRQAAIDWIRQHPTQAVELYVGKWLNHFHFHNTLYTDGQTSLISKLAVALTYYPLLLLCLLRLCYRREYPLHAMEKFILVLYVMNACLSAIFFTRLRFRIPFDLLLIPVAAIAWQITWQRYQNKRSNRTA